MLRQGMITAEQLRRIAAYLSMAMAMARLHLRGPVPLDVRIDT